ncbi:MAG: addiction module protein [Deltaproteobacteria bacterium]|nr:addiction module protein [Deltaproteobacteria bacterium]
MSARATVFDQALALPAQDRAALAHDLLRSLDDADDPDADQAWLIEIERRAAEVDAGTAVLDDWSAVRERLASRWRKR